MGAGSLLSESAIAGLDHVIDYLEAGRWMRAVGVDAARRANRREQLWDIGGRKAGNEKVLYMEFGVYRGGSMKCWGALLQHPESSLHGFDTFEGLPEGWRPWIPKSALSTDGQIPGIADRRVRFFKGLFQETLPRYTPPPRMTYLSSTLIATSTAALITF